MTVATEHRFDDLALDYTVGEVLQALSVRETRGDLPQWAIPYVAYLATTLVLRPEVPQYVVEAAAVTCQQLGYTIPLAVDALRWTTEGTSSRPRGLRSLRGFLEEWRRQLHQRRPKPVFMIRPR